VKKKTEKKALPVKPKKKKKASTLLGKETTNKYPPGIVGCFSRFCVLGLWPCVVVVRVVFSRSRFLCALQGFLSWVEVQGEACLHPWLMSPRLPIQALLISLMK
jgi:hypothetical protein